eukprot:8340171-Ditylum_brightwellii.AAC.1
MGVTQKYDNITASFMDTVVETPPRSPGRGGKANEPLMLKPAVDPRYAKCNLSASSIAHPHHGHGTQKNNAIPSCGCTHQQRLIHTPCRRPPGRCTP